MCNYNRRKCCKDEGHGALFESVTSECIAPSQDHNPSMPLLGVGRHVDSSLTTAIKLIELDTTIRQVSSRIIILNTNFVLNSKIMMTTNECPLRSLNRFNQCRIVNYYKVLTMVGFIFN